MHTRLIIARHGNTFAQGEIVTRLGVTDLPLVASGEAQARALGAYLLSENMMPDVAYTSTLKRTIHMAELARKFSGGAFPCYADVFFNEIDYGEDENIPEARVIERVGAEALRLWDEQCVAPKGWNVDVNALIAGWKSFARRIAVEHRGRVILVVTSNGIARFAPHLTGDMAAFQSQHTLKLATGAMCVLEHEGAGEQWECRAWGVRP